VLLVSGGRKVKNPREENYWDMLVSTFCPTFSFLSVTIFLILADIAMFIAELAVGFNTQGEFLEVNSYSLNKLGANYGPEVANGEVYRLVSAIFLHTTFFHILGNLFSTFILVTRI
jgi:membrane associated rhomboid family serine protease